MERGALLLAVACACTMAARAQELLPNGGFEDHTACPDYIGEIDRATGWSRPTTGTSDYLHSCSTDPFASVPSSQFGDQPAHGGDGFVGFYAFSACDTVADLVDGYREYVTHALSAPLEIGHAYRVHFFVSLAEISDYAIHDVGALFSIHPPHRDDDRVLNAAPQVPGPATAWLDDPDGWTDVSGCFIADSAYAFITLGNFRDSASTAVHYVGSPISDQGFCYYFLDDVSVMPAEAPHLGPDTTVCHALTIAVLDPVAGMSYIWNTGDTAASITVDTSGTYSVRTASGCLLSDSIRVTIAAPFAIGLPPDTLVDLCANSSVRIGPDSLPPDAQFQWSTGTTQPWIDVSAPGSYTITITGPGICASEASITVIDGCAHPVLIPNAFTPNGDGINDVWRPQWLSNPDALLALAVYDRWGRTLFTAEDGRSGWNGEAGGGPVPIGVYAYRLSAMDAGSGTARTINGHVTVIR